jgi:hypothetical protein
VILIFYIFLASFALLRCVWINNVETCLGIWSTHTIFFLTCGALFYWWQYNNIFLIKFSNMCDMKIFPKK